MSYWTEERTVTISQNEYRQFQQDRIALQDAQTMAQYYQNLIRAQEKTVGELATQADIANGRIDALSSELQKAIGKNTSIEKIVVEQNRTLHRMNESHKEQIKRIEDNLQSKIKEVRDEGSRAVAKAYRDFSDAMQQNNRHIEQAIQTTAQGILNKVDAIAADLREEMGEISQHVAEMNQGNDELSKMAHDYYAAAQAVLKDVENNCPHHNALCADQLASAQTGLAIAKENLDIVDRGNRMNAGTAQGFAYSAFTEAMVLRARAYVMESIWQEHFQLAMSSLVTAESRVEAARSVAVGKDPETGEVIRIDGDEWSEGGLSRVSLTVAGLADRLRSDGGGDDTVLSIEEIDGVREALERAAIEADEAANDAYIAVALSQQRADKAEDFADVAEALNLDVEDFSYYRGDQRKGLRVWLTNAVTGLKVTLTFEPGGRGGNPGQRVIVDVAERGNTTDEGIAALLQQIDEYLHGCGGNPSEIVRKEPTAESTQACTARTDIDAWKNGTTQEFVETGEGAGGWESGGVSARAMG